MILFRINKIFLFNKKSFKWWIVVAAALIHLFFYYSALKTHTLDKFFLGITPGQDFFQIPNAAYSFIRGGDLQGNLNGQENAYINCCGVNKNVYHPAFTLLVGIPLQLFKPWTSFNLWLFLHLLVSIFVVVFLIRNFKNHKYLPLALIIFLTSSFQYYEILNNQYHFLFDLFTFLFLYENLKNNDSLKAGVFYFIGLIVKPIGLLWLLPLVIYKKFKIILIGLGLYLAITVPFYFLPEGQPFFNNFLGTAKGIVPNYNLVHLFRLFGQNLNTVYFWEVIFLLAFSAIFILKKPKFITAVLFITGFQLIFYGGTYPYHYSILPFILSLWLLVKDRGFKLIESVALIFLSLPAPIYFANIFPGNLQQIQVTIFVFWTMLPLLLFLICLYVRSLVALIKNSKNEN